MRPPGSAHSQPTKVPQLMTAARLYFKSGAMNRPDSLNALRDATQEVHSQLESHLTINRPGAGRDEYLKWARAMYGWLSTFEDKLWSAPWPAAVDAGRRNGKRAWLATDLIALGESDASMASLPVADAQLHLQTEAKRFGAAYVLEGSTLGGQVLLRHLGPQLAPSEGRYLQGYGAETGAMWQRFSQALGTSLQTPSDLEHAIASARYTFGSLAQWFTARGIG